MLIILMIITGLCCFSVQARAASSLQVVMEDALWGAAIGTMVGAATLPFMEHPSEHYDRLAKGAGLGLIGGLAFGAYEIAPVFYATKDPVSKETVYGFMLSLPLK